MVDSVKKYRRLIFIFNFGNILFITLANNKAAYRFNRGNNNVFISPTLNLASWFIPQCDEFVKGLLQVSFGDLVKFLC